LFSTESDEKATTQHVAFPFDNCESNAAFKPALERLSQVVDTESSCGYVTLVNLAKKTQMEEQISRPPEEGEVESSQSPSAQNLGSHWPDKYEQIHFCEGQFFFF
jgi:hypothetical protein